MVNVPRMISLEPRDAEWFAGKGINVSGFVRDAVEVCRDVDERKVSGLVSRLRLINGKMQELMAAYEQDKYLAKATERVGDGK